jgi:hypothetical protein
LTPTVAYLASGKLFLKRDGRAAEPIESAFAEEILADAARRREKNEWKTRSSTGQMMAGITPWGAGQDAESRRIHISGITRGSGAHELLYALDTDLVGGLFVYDLTERVERRLFHHNRFKARNLSRHPEQPLVTFAVAQDDGTSEIAVMNLETNALHHVTEGDSLDEAPSWLPGSGTRLVFQSAGLARNEQGVVMGVGPFAIQELDADNGTLNTVIEAEKLDFLLPKSSPDGTLYFIRRPYQAVPKPSLVRILLDVLLFPLRLLWALLGFLNFFSLMFSGKPLMTAGGVKREGPSPRHMMLWGKLIDAEQAERRARNGDPADLVPRDWELLKRTPDGREAVLAQGVVSYDLCDDGGVVYTNGSAVFHLDAGGTRQQLCTGKLIEHVAVTA